MYTKFKRYNYNGQSVSGSYPPKPNLYSHPLQRQSTLKNVSCVNCGERGHIVKSCKKPITSFGIIAFKQVFSKEQEYGDTNKELNLILNVANKKNPIKEDEYPKIKFLMIQRKDTMGFIDFIRGKYPSDEVGKLQKIRVCFNEMTYSEKEMLRTQNFDALWSYLWINHNSRCFLNEYENAKKKFNNLPIKEYLKESKITYDYSELGYPKGRRNITESNITCAEREFHEETGYTKNCYEYIKNYPIIKEEFMGTNDVEYRHIYYLVKMKDTAPIPLVDKTDKIQTGEVRNIGWFTLNESISLLRDYDTAKKDMIIKVNSNLLQMKNYDCSPIFYNTYIKQDKEMIYKNIKENYINSDNILI